MSRLVLGTAQWGNAYGVTNTRGRLSDQEIRDIVEVAHSRDIREVDTARGYGDAESRLSPYARDFDITTKVSGSGDVSAQIRDSLADLHVESVATVLIHDWHVLEPRQQSNAIRDLGSAVDAGFVIRIGVSIYEESEIEPARDAFASQNLDLGALQVPANPIDRRLDESTLLGELRSAGADITVRSVFLQGALLADDSRWSDHPAVSGFRAFAAKQQTSPLEACLGHVRGLPWASHVVVGATNARELREISAAWNACEVKKLPSLLASLDEHLIDPRSW